MPEHIHAASKTKWDVVIIGAGSAGLTAAVYTCRKKLSTLILSVDVGGQTILTNHIENYPGFFKETPGYPSGPKLMQIFEEQAKHFGAEIIMGKVTKVEVVNESPTPENPYKFVLELSNGERYEARVVLLAYGKVPRELGIPGEKKFIGRGVSTCATCDAPLFRNKNVAVIGGGNSAVEAAELLTKFASKVYLVHRRDQFRADEITMDKVKASPKVELVLNSMPAEIKGDKFVSGLVVQNVNTQETRELPVHGVFVEIGYIVVTDFVKDYVEVNKANEIVVNENCETRTPGLFSAGDLTNIPFKQTITSAGQGAIAGLSAYNYLMRLQGKAGIKADWA
ncbi:MAG: thioredoxin-disulfide reductase [Candidatus Aenigmarchaeota archaeon]|nr:thioredoxin-disulfide reductase [Candidatus Aenigmarchaeota archaeon]